MRLPAGACVRTGAVVLAIGLAGACVSAAPQQVARAKAPSDASTWEGPPLQLVLARARKAHWDTLAIGERIARFALTFKGAPYLDGTLEGPGPEVCRVTTGGFDCVTFMELCLDLARVTEPGRAETATPEDVRAAVTFTRYRGGRLTDYTSRLHYTSEWIADNVAKGVIEDVTPSLGGTSCAATVNFMSTHPKAYPALVAHPAYVDSMRRIERAVSRLQRVCIPRGEVARVESRFRTGDLVAIVTSVPGLDYAHTGLIVRDESGVPHFMHASSKHGRVFLDGRLSKYLAGAPRSFTGVTILRPLEVAGGR